MYVLHTYSPYVRGETGRVGAEAHPPVPPTDKDMPRERYEEEEDGFEKFEK